MAPKPEGEWLTRKKRIDPKLDRCGWAMRRGATGGYHTEEHPTANGPADYALCLADNVVGVVEAKKVTVGPQGVLTQAERYSRGLSDSAYDFDGFKVPFGNCVEGGMFRVLTPLTSNH